MAIMAFSSVIGAANNLLSVSRVDYSIIIDGEPTVFNYPIIRLDNRVYVSIRELSELLGYEVIWNGEANEILLNSKEETENIFALSTEGTLPSGIEYKFRGNDEGIFSLEDFVGRWHLTMQIKLEYVDIASSPTEAAEIGQHHFRERARSLSEIQADGVLRFIINVYYCYKTNNWVLHLDYYRLDGLPLISRERPDILVINRITGSMYRYIRW